jgi:trehalose 6-phosphate synthase
MSLEERRERWDVMIDRLRAGSVQGWFSDFVRALDDVRGAAPMIAARSLSPMSFGRAEQKNVARTH